MEKGPRTAEYVRDSRYQAALLEGTFRAAKKPKQVSQNIKCPCSSMEGMSAGTTTGTASRVSAFLRLSPCSTFPLLLWPLCCLARPRIPVICFRCLSHLRLLHHPRCDPNPCSLMSILSNMTDALQINPSSWNLSVRCSSSNQSAHALLTGVWRSVSRRYVRCILGCNAA